MRKDFDHEFDLWVNITRISTVSEKSKCVKVKYGQWDSVSIIACEGYII